MAKTLLETGKMNAGNYGGIPDVAVGAGLGFPPVYFFILGIWARVFGESIEAIRALSLTIGLLSAIIFYFLANAIFTRKGSLLPFFQI